VGWSTQRDVTIDETIKRRSAPTDTDHEAGGRGIGKARRPCTVSRAEGGQRAADKTGNGQHGRCGKMRLFLCALSTRSKQASRPTDRRRNVAYYDAAVKLAASQSSSTGDACRRCRDGISDSFTRRSVPCDRIPFTTSAKCWAKAKKLIRRHAV